MARIEGIKILSHFKDNYMGDIHGTYRCKIDGEWKTLIRHGEELGVITFWLGRPVKECISIVRSDVKQRIFSLVDKEFERQEGIKILIENGVNYNEQKSDT